MVPEGIRERRREARLPGQRRLQPGDRGRAERAAGVPADDRQRLVDRHGCAIRAVGGQGVEDVGDGQDARRARQVEGGQAAVVAGPVEALDYEAYAEMALAKLRAIGAEEAERHGLCAVALVHRTGRVPLSEPSVIVAAGAAHRGEAFAGARALIDRVKAEAPIWKVEVDGADRRRVEGTLPPTR
jgi:hypothetical protein